MLKWNHLFWPCLALSTRNGAQRCGRGSLRLPATKTAPPTGTGLLQDHPQTRISTPSCRLSSDLPYRHLSGPSPTSPAPSFVYSGRAMQVGPPRIRWHSYLRKIHLTVIFPSSPHPFIEGMLYGSSAGVWPTLLRPVGTAVFSQATSYGGGGRV